MPFLSCLRGSEHDDAGSAPSECFLSCLRGSEHEERRAADADVFLSCLRGSEPIGPHTGS